MVIRGAVFDLDDTLYPERLYIESGFRAVAERIAALGPVPADAAYGELIALGDDPSMRGRVIDELLRRRPALAAATTAAELVGAYRTHRPRIEPFPGLVGVLTSLRSKGIQIGLITDGPVVGQTAKLAALGLEPWFDPVLITDSWGIEFRKPHPRAFTTIQEAWGLRGDDLVYVGDNPAKDFIAPNRLSWTTIRFDRPGQRHRALEPPDRVAAADATVSGVDGLASWFAANT